MSPLALRPSDLQLQPAPTTRPQPIQSPAKKDSLLHVPVFSSPREIHHPDYGYGYPSNELDYDSGIQHLEYADELDTNALPPLHLPPGHNSPFLSQAYFDSPVTTQSPPPLARYRGGGGIMGDIEIEVESPLFARGGSVSLPGLTTSRTNTTDSGCSFAPTESYLSSSSASASTPARGIIHRQPRYHTSSSSARKEESQPQILVHIDEEGGDVTETECDWEGFDEDLATLRGDDGWGQVDKGKGKAIVRGRYTS